MSKNSKNTSFIELLCLNSESELKKFLINHGKDPKPRCPIMFIKDQEKENENNVELQEI